MPENRRLYALCRVLLLIILKFSAPMVYAEWSVRSGISSFYTDDVALFSVTRRLSLKEDPTQPTVDRPQQGGDFVWEPNAEIEWKDRNSLGEISFNVDAGGYIFTDQSKFTHGLYEFQVSQTLPTATKVSLLYNLVPDLYLGQNEFRRLNGEEIERDETLTNHYWSLHLDQPISETLTLRLLARYGLRKYNEPFAHRDTRFWTVGPHLEWEINPDMDLLVGYHYEKGFADHLKAAHFPDDVSYINHYASAEFKVRLLERLVALFIFDFEKNDFTSRKVVDEHYGAAETVYQGEIELLYELTESADIKLGWQHGNRALNTEDESIKNNNVWLGVEYSY